LGAPVQQSKGVGGGPREGVLIEHFFGQGADQGFPAEFAAVLFERLGQNVVNVEGAMGILEYVFDYIHIRLTFLCGCRWRGLGFSPQGSEGFELRTGGCFQYFQQFIMGDGIIWHKVWNIFDKVAYE
jgi:hypothetical protein